MTRLSESWCSMNYKNLCEAILLQAIKGAQAYTLDDFHRSDVWPFMKSKWFEDLCDAVGFILIASEY